MKLVLHSLIAMFLVLVGCSKDDPVTPEQISPPSYTPNLIFIDFQDDIIRRDLLCSPDNPSAEEKDALRNERFTLDELLINQAIFDALVDINGVRFKRIHTYNPCGDSTFTISNGPPLRIAYFRHIALELEEKDGSPNDLLAICNMLETQYVFGIRDATPNFFAIADKR